MTAARALAEIPRAAGAPVVGHTLSWLRDPVGTPVRMREALGDVFVHNIFFSRPVVFAHPDALGEIFADEGEHLSTAAGWRPFFGRLLPSGLLLRDHADHRYHRGLVQSAFSTPALKEYLRVMNARVAAIVDGWRGRREVQAVPTFRQLTLDLAATLFLGVEVGDKIATLTHDFETLARGVAALVPAPLPGTALRRAMRARAALADYLRGLVAARRRAPSSSDMLGMLCQATDAEGRRYTDDEVVDHTLFLWMAAHDTTTGSLVMAAYELARDTTWQQRLRDEARALGPELTWERMGDARLAEQVVNEVLRLYPPVGSVPRETLRACVVGGVSLPAKTPLRASILLAQRHPTYWSRPHEFDPDRFSEERAEHKRHKHAFRPFGGGAHTCLGMRFAMLQIKCVMHHLLTRYRLSLPEGYTLTLRPTPSLRPADDLPLRLDAVEASA